MGGRLAPKRGCHGCILSMVHSVCTVLAPRAVCVGDLPLRLALDIAAACFRHRRSRSFELDQCTFLSPSEVASRTTRYLTRRSVPIDYRETNRRVFR